MKHLLMDTLQEIKFKSQCDLCCCSAPATESVSEIKLNFNFKLLYTKFNKRLSLQILIYLYLIQDILMVFVLVLFF